MRWIISFLIAVVFNWNLIAQVRPGMPDFGSTVLFIVDEGGHPCGTGFFVAAKIPEDTSVYFPVLVTARHVLMKDCETLKDTIYLRANMKGEGIGLIRYPLKIEGRRTFFTHPTDKQVDIAVIPMVPDTSRYKFTSFSEEMVMTRKTISEEEIHPGDEVVFCGMFPSFMGMLRNNPIYRFGRISVMPEEKINLYDNKCKTTSPSDLYLVECFAFGGNSGSPLLIHLGFLRRKEIKVGEPLIDRYFIGGVVCGYFPEYNLLDTLQLRQTSTKTTASTENTGIAYVTPSYKLSEILQGDELLSWFRQALRKRK